VKPKTSLSVGRTLHWFSVNLLSFPQKLVEQGPKVGLYHPEFLRADRHGIGQVIDGVRRRRLAAVRRDGDLVCPPSPVFLPTGAWRAARHPHGDISQPQARKTRQTQLNAADAKRIWRRMVEIESEKNQKQSGFYASFASAQGFTKD
jgi:hypothetical protein